MLHMQAPLVGSTAPDFSATAVFDQEFIDVKLSQYRVSSRLSGGHPKLEPARRHIGEEHSTSAS